MSGVRATCAGYFTGCAQQVDTVGMFPCNSAVDRMRARCFELVRKFARFVKSHMILALAHM